MRINDRAAEQTAGPRRQAETLLLQVYLRGYKDGEAAERERGAKRRKAYWRQDARDENWFSCSACGILEKISPQGAVYTWYFCPHCGASMGDKA